MFVSAVILFAETCRCISMRFPRVYRMDDSKIRFSSQPINYSRNQWPLWHRTSNLSWRRMVLNMLAKYRLLSIGYSSISQRRITFTSEIRINSVCRWNGYSNAISHITMTNAIAMSRRKLPSMKLMSYIRSTVWIHQYNTLMNTANLLLHFSLENFYVIGELNRNLYIDNKRKPDWNTPVEYSTLCVVWKPIAHCQYSAWFTWTNPKRCVRRCTIRYVHSIHTQHLIPPRGINIKHVQPSRNETKPK